MGVVVREAWAGRREPEQLLREDARTLKLMGSANKFEFAEAAECSLQIAHRRLGRLVDAGFATKWKVPGHAAFTYAATVPAGASER